MADTAALFSSFFLMSAAAFLFSRGVTLPWPSKTRPSPAAKSALLAELASAEARLRSTAPAVRAFGGRVAAAEAAGREPADRDALKALGFLGFFCTVSGFAQMVPKCPKGHAG